VGRLVGVLADGGVFRAGAVPADLAVDPAVSLVAGRRSMPPLFELLGPSTPP
jgi:hypothetical protein